ncbi:MAG: VWA domain-containing protein [Pseudomonadota bacterium]
MAQSRLLETSEWSALQPIQVGGRPIIDFSSQILSAIRRRLSEEQSLLLARPARRSGESQVDWYTTREGEVQRLSDLSPAEQARVVSEVQSALGEIARFGETLSQRRVDNLAVLAAGLEALGGKVSAQQIYLVGGKPVVTAWGFESVASPAAAPSPSAALTSSAATQTDNAPTDSAGLTEERSSAAATVASQGAVASAIGIGAWLRWLLLLLMLALLAAMVWWAQQPLTPIAQKRERPSEDLSDEIARNQANKSMIIKELLALDERRDALVEQCIAERQPPPTPPVVKDEPRLATEYCPSERIVRPDLVLVYDNSSSMAFPLNMPENEIKPYYQAYQQQYAQAQMRQGMQGLLQRMMTGRAGAPVKFPSVADWVRQRLPAQALRKYGPRRSEVAKPIVTKVLRQTPSDTAVSLVAFSDCKQIKTVKGRRQVLDYVNRLEPMRGTAIAASIGLAARQLDGTREDASGVIILLTDGIESCSGDPCATAAAIKKAKPWTAIHVVKLGPESSSACVAKNTQGNVYQPKSTDQLAKVLTEAQITSPFPLQCRK